MADSKPHVFPMPRTAFVFLITSVVLSVLPHMQRVPVWLQLVFGVVMVWRIQVFRQRLTFPPRWVRLLLVCCGVLAIVYHHGTIFGPDAGVALLITAYLFKQLEMYTRRDAFLVVILSFFVLATEFLFSSSLFTSIYVFVVLVVISSALVALNMSGTNIALWRPLKVALISILQAVPLLLVLFFLFPRIGPIWELGMQTKSARTGLSESISPGDIAELSLSTELAFRVDFDGAIPEPRDRYWRALIFDRFDGRTWHAQKEGVYLPFDPARLEKAGEPLSYRVYLEPTGQDWLPAIAWANLNGIRHKTANSLVNYAEQLVDNPVSYAVESYFQYQYEALGMPRESWVRYTTLPPSGNSRALAWGRELYRQTGGAPALISNGILERFRREEFVYTLKPPKLGANSIDEFLFETKKGFCAHYAGAFVYLMRAAGIPARMVGGYQGGESHPIGNYLLVHQYDAHAWVEFWDKGKGWVHVDPTAAIAPHRIETGSLRQSLDEESLRFSPFSDLDVRNLPMLEELRMMADYVDYLWFKNVVSFDHEAQNRLLQAFLGEVTPKRIALLLGICGGFVVLCLAGWMLYSQRPIHRLSKADRHYMKFLSMLARKGLDREVGEGIDAFSRRAQEQFPEQKNNINKISNIYSEIKYSKSGESGSQGNKSATKSDSIAALEQQLGQAVASLKI